MCSAHATVRGLLGELVQRADDGDVVVDMEAGLEHMSRGTGRHVTRFLAVLEPYYRSMETARRVVALAAELGVTDVKVLANKVRDDADREAIEAFCAANDMRVAGVIPFDATLAEAERQGRPPIEHAPDGPAMSALRTLLPGIT
jgi:CO dehydrogenase maturation factor